LGGLLAPAGEGGGQRLLHVGGVANEGGAVAQEEVAAGGAGVERVAGDRQHLAPLVGGGAGGDERAGAFGGLDHHDAQRQARDDAVAGGEVAGLRLEPDGMLAQPQALGGDVGGELPVLGRVDVVHATGHHGHGAGGERGPVRGRVHPAGEARDDGEARLSEPLGEGAGHAEAQEEALRAPTSATVGRRRSDGSPSVQRSGGASGRPARRAG
jgi:hypothetical protein